MRTPVVLFVDDEKNLLQGVKRALRKTPYEVHLAQNAEEALRVLALNDVQVLCTDQRMPGLNGLQLLEVVRASFPDIVRIMLTGHASLGMAVAAINRGEVFRFLTKPFDSTELVMTLKDAFELVELSSRGVGERSKQMACKSEREALEREFPGITELDVDDEGVILVNFPVEQY